MHARRTDANHAAVRDAMRSAGAVVVDLSGVGKGVPDTMVFAHGAILLVEIKDGEKVPSARELTKPQVDFIALAWSQRVPVHVVTSPAEAVALVRGAVV